MFRIGTRGWLAVALAVGSTGPALGWESDLHYGVTRQMALAAGFTEAQAEAVAAGNQGMDDDWSTNAVPLVVMGILLNPDKAQAKKVSEQVRDLHFAWEGQLPAAHTSRAVMPDARRPRDNALAACRQGRYRETGRHLHAYQDSWSHQGIPGTPVPWRTDLVWAHPDARGGPSKSRADWTYEYPSDAYATARGTLAVFLACRDRGGELEAVWTSAKPWLDRCIAAKTKEDKASCYPQSLTAGLRSRQFRSTLNLPNGEDFRPELSGVASPSNRKLAASPALPPADVPAGLKREVDRVLGDWLLEQDFAAAAERFRPGREGALPGVPVPGPQDLKKRLETYGAAQDGTLPPPSPEGGLERHIQSVSEPGRSYDVVDTAKLEGDDIPADYVVAFQFKNRPRQASLLLLEQDGGAYVPKGIVDIGM